ncbi:maleylpyruvate isomerase [Actinomycetota bacterium]|nr:maleylpyruvate isomerase [Actinomycetota bacterium]
MAVTRAADNVAGAAVLTEVVVLREALERVLAGLTDADVAAPSLLAGWTRGHVLAHLAGVGAALARQLELTPTGRLVPLYDGGQAGRDAAIEDRAGASARTHAHDVAAVARRVESAMSALGPDDWTLVTGHRDRSVLDVAHSWWRELGIHTTDLGLGIVPAAWSPALCAHLAGYLAPRVATPAVLVPDDGVSGPWAVGPSAAGPASPQVDGQVDGLVDVPVVSGERTDLVAWLAGRAPHGSLVARHRGSPAALPALLDLWP